MSDPVTAAVRRPRTVRRRPARFGNRLVAFCDRVRRMTPAKRDALVALIGLLAKHPRLAGQYARTVRAQAEGPPFAAARAREAPG